MASKDERLHVVFNGEILNYREVRGQSALSVSDDGRYRDAARGIRCVRGPSFVEHLAGQFAFAIHDGNDGSVWLYRDRLGILPLYYWLDDDQLVFASEIKALFPALPRRPEVDQQGLGGLSRTSLGAGARHPLCGRAQAQTRPPSPCHGEGAAQASTAGGRCLMADAEQAVSGDVATALVADALRASVERNLVADVPVGAYLSGGVDSSLIVALMTELVGSEKVHTFSAGFGDPELDEVHHALRGQRTSRDHPS